MSDTWRKVLQLIAANDYVVSAHGYDERRRMIYFSPTCLRASEMLVSLRIIRLLRKGHVHS
jgi:hypothetical protein